MHLLHKVRIRSLRAHAPLLRLSSLPLRLRLGVLCAPSPVIGRQLLQLLSLLRAEQPQGTTFSSLALCFSFTSRVFACACSALAAIAFAERRRSCTAAPPRSVVLSAPTPWPAAAAAAPCLRWLAGTTGLRGSILPAAAACGSSSATNGTQEGKEKSTRASRAPVVVPWTPASSAPWQNWPTSAARRGQQHSP